MSRINIDKQTSQCVRCETNTFSKLLLNPKVIVGI